MASSPDGGSSSKNIRCVYSLGDQIRTADRKSHHSLHPSIVEQAHAMLNNHAKSCGNPANMNPPKPAKQPPPPQKKIALQGNSIDPRKTPYKNRYKPTLDHSVEILEANPEKTMHATLYSHVTQYHQALEGNSFNETRRQAYTSSGPS